MIFAVMFFVIVTFFLGLAISKKFSWINFGYGLGALTLIITILRLKVTWEYYMILAVAIGALICIKYKSKISIKKPSFWFILAILVVSLHTGFYLKGAFSYPWLEDGDPWHHAMGVVHTAETGSWSIPYYPDEFRRDVYLEPYPPAYDAIMALMYDIQGDVIWVLKTFNVLIISIALICAFYMSKSFFKSERSAFIATACFAMIPFMSHFIWSQTLALALFFPAIYALHKKEYTASIICTTAILVSQPSCGFIYGMVFFVPYLIFNRKMWVFLTGAISVILSLGYWIPTYVKFGATNFFVGLGWKPGFMALEDVSGSYGVYSLVDFFTVPLSNKIDQMFGFGWVVMVLIFISVFVLIKAIRKKHNIPAATKEVLVWLVICVIGTLGNYLPVNLLPHRFWAFLTIPIVLLIVPIMEALKEAFGKYKYIALTVILAGILITAGIPKMQVQTMQWTFGDSFGVDPKTAQDELRGMLYLKDNIAEDTPIWDLCWNEERVRSFGFYMPSLDIELTRFRNDLPNKTVDDVYAMAVKRNLPYVLVTPVCARNYMSFEQLNNLLMNITESDKFGQVIGLENFFMYATK